MTGLHHDQDGQHDDEDDDDDDDGDDDDDDVDDLNGMLLAWQLTIYSETLIAS